MFVYDRKKAINDGSYSSDFKILLRDGNKMKKIAVGCEFLMDIREMVQ